MRFTPLDASRVKHRPVAVVAPGLSRLSIWSADGAEVADGPDNARDLLARYADHVLWSASSMRMVREATGHEGWQICRWNNSVVWQQLGKARVLSTRGIFAGEHPAVMIETMLRIQRTAAEFGVSMGSWSTMTLSLWRATLDEPVAFAGREIARQGFYGGRKEAARWAVGAMLENVAHVDLKGAYPAAMFSDPLPTRLVRARRPHLEGEGIVLAEVHMPSAPWAMLPERLRSGLIRWRSGRTVEGWYSTRELRAVVEAGGDVIPLETWEGVRFVEPFTRWASVIGPLRDRPGPEGRWWKGVSNSLWGTFIMSPAGAELVRLDESGRPAERVPMVRRRSRRPLNAAYVATLTTARVRERVLRDALGLGWEDKAVYVDTDGVMILDGGRLPPSATDRPAPGEWAVDRIMPKVMIRGSQAWAWWDEDDQPHVSMAGIRGATLDHLYRISPGQSVVM